MDQMAAFFSTRCKTKRWTMDDQRLPPHFKHLKFSVASLLFLLVAEQHYVQVHSVQYKVCYYPHEKHRIPFLNATYALKDELDLLVEFRTTFLKSATADAIYREIVLDIRKIHPGFTGQGEWLNIYWKIPHKNEIELNFGSNFTLNGSGLESILTRHDRNYVSDHNRVHQQREFGAASQ